MSFSFWECMSDAPMGSEPSRCAPPLLLLLPTAPPSTWQGVSDTLELGQTLRPKRRICSSEKETAVERVAPL